MVLDGLHSPDGLEADGTYYQSTVVGYTDPGLLTQCVTLETDGTSGAVITNASTGESSSSLQSFL